MKNKEQKIINLINFDECPNRFTDVDVCPLCGQKHERRPEMIKEYGFSSTFQT